MRRFLRLGFGLAVLSVSVLMAGPAPAGGCYQGSYGYSYGQSPSYSYSSPNYGYTYYSPPSYPVYYPVVQKEYYPVYHEREVQVPYAKPVYVNRDYYYSLRDYYEDKKRDDVVAEAAAYKALLLGAQLQQVQQGQSQVQTLRQSYGYQVQPGAALLQAPVAGGYGQLAYQQPVYAPPQQPAYAMPQQPAYQQPQQPQQPAYGAPAAPQVPAPQPAPQQAPQQAQPEAPAQPTSPSTRPRPRGHVALTDVNPKLVAVVKNQCLRCHNGKEERMDLSDLASLNVGERSYAESLVRAGLMPRGGEPLSDADSKLFEEHTAKAHKAILAKR